MNIRRVFLFVSLLLGCARPQGDDASGSDPATLPSQPPSTRSSEPVVEDDDGMSAREEDEVIQAAREQMIEHHLQGRDITDPEVIAAMRRTPRHKLLPPSLTNSAYRDQPLPIGHGQTISQPYIVALMTQLARVKPNCVALDVGTGSGYQAAVLAEMGAKVYSIEIVPELAEEARAKLRELGYKQIEVRHGDGYRGWPEHAPFDVIIVAAAPDHIPQPLVDQLAPGGHLVIPVGDYFQSLIVVEKLGRRHRETTQRHLCRLRADDRRSPKTPTRRLTRCGIPFRVYWGGHATGAAHTSGDQSELRSSFAGNVASQRARRRGDLRGPIQGS